MHEDLIKIPEKVAYILDTLKRHGFEAYAVGGCVRDMFLGRTPNDWDITTSARPEEVKKLFRRTVDTGIAHGTVTVMMGTDGYEVTTYRLDGKYSDGRHPDEVTFTPNLAEDLMRRDFTINAMACNLEDGLVDLYGGLRDLRDGIIRCVGDPDARFGEDALRVMRAVRFAAQLGFKIDGRTRDGVRTHSEMLRKISAERIRVELMKLITSPHPDRVRDLYELGITAVILPEFDICMKTDQNTRHHMYTVGEHIIASMREILPDPVLRLTMLLHDIGKPNVRKTDRNGVDHFYGHASVGARMADEVLRRLKFDNATRKAVVNLVRWHDLRPEPVESEVRRAASLIGTEQFEDYLRVQKADNLAKSMYMREQKLRRVSDVGEMYRMIRGRGDCLTVGELAVNGNDLLGLGIRGPKVGEMLGAALKEVLEDPERNTKEYLTEFLKKM
ncbi:MAG: HDIG domain-containing protein [Lachnospiraceae bacterium]|nr:HDIG domain-containing protein [Lachnospiraceae bacterium]